MSRSLRVPHARAGGPSTAWRTRGGAECSPRACGWTGIDPRRRRVSICVPHARAGGPSGPSPPAGGAGCSPRACGWTVLTGWRADRDPCSPRACGWTGRGPGPKRSPWVFPTRVRVDRRMPLSSPDSMCVPHARGGGPGWLDQCAVSEECSPRAWGWTAGRRRRGPACRVFPTRVGVDRSGRSGPGQG